MGGLLRSGGLLRGGSDRVGAWYCRLGEGRRGRHRRVLAGRKHRRPRRPAVRRRLPSWLAGRWRRRGATDSTQIGGRLVSSRLGSGCFGWVFIIAEPVEAHVPCLPPLAHQPHRFVGPPLKAAREVGAAHGAWAGGEGRGAAGRAREERAAPEQAPPTTEALARLQRAKQLVPVAHDLACPCATAARAPNLAALTRLTPLRLRAGHPLTGAEGGGRGCR